MTMQFLAAATDAQGCPNFTVWLDTAKSTKDGHPDPSYVQSYPWPIQPKGWSGASLNGVEYTTWADYCAAETKLLAQAKLDAINAAQNPTPAPTPLSVQGQTF